jgi:DNA-3-methyladenine glycosylase II
MHRSAVTHLRRSDPVLARVIERVGPCRFRPRAEGGHFDAVLRSIIYQQLSGSAAHTIHTRFLALFDGAAPDPARLLDVPDDVLRAVGLPRQKIGYMRDLAARVHRAEMPIHTLHELEDDAIIAVLTSVKGVGRWTAQMFLMFRLGRPDVLPEMDLGIRKAIQRAYRTRGLPTAERVQRVGAPWAPYRTVASWYLWRSLEVDGASATPPGKRQGGDAAAARPAPKAAPRRNGAAKRAGRGASRGTSGTQRGSRGRRAR